MILYYKDTGMIFKKVIPNQPIEDYLFHYSSEEINNIGVIYDMDFINARDKIFQDGEIRSMTDIEVAEMIKYGKFLSQDERLLESMKPSMEEVREAEQTIKILSLMQEVM